MGGDKAAAGDDAAGGDKAAAGDKAGADAAGGDKAGADAAGGDKAAGDAKDAKAAGDTKDAKAADKKDAKTDPPAACKDKKGDELTKCTKAEAWKGKDCSKETDDAKKKECGCPKLRQSPRRHRRL